MTSLPCTLQIGFLTEAMATRLLFVEPDLSATLGSSTYSPLRSDKTNSLSSPEKDRILLRCGASVRGIRGTSMLIDLTRDVNGRKTHFYIDDQRHRLSDKESVHLWSWKFVREQDCSCYLNDKRYAGI